MKKLYRSRDNRKVGGVCGGIAEYFGFDPTLVRLAAVIFIFVWGSGLLAYVVAWAIIPERPAHVDVDYEVKSEPVAEEKQGNNNSNQDSDGDNNDDPKFYDI